MLGQARRLMSLISITKVHDRAGTDYQSSEFVPDQLSLSRLPGYDVSALTCLFMFE